MKDALEILQTQSRFNIATSVIAVASIVTAVTPTPKRGSVLAKVYKGIEILALNIGKAKDRSK